MFKLFVTLLRGRNADAADALTNTLALPILRQQLRDCAGGVETARRAVAMVMAYAERERKAAARINAQLADLETRALDALAKREPRRAKVIELRYFGGLSVDETAEALGVSPQTVLRDWKLARAWLAVELRSSSRR